MCVLFILVVWSFGEALRSISQVLGERDTECKDLRLTISELETNTNDLHNKFEAALAHLEQEADEKDAQIETLNEAMEKLSEQVYILEDENDRLKEDHEKMKEEDDAERERLETLTAALREVRVSYSQFQEFANRHL